MQKKGIIIAFALLLTGWLIINQTVGKEDHGVLIRTALDRLGSAETMTGTLRFETIGLFSLEQITDQVFRVPFAVEGPVAFGFTENGLLYGHAELTAGPSEVDDPESDMGIDVIATQDGLSHLRFTNIPDDATDAPVSIAVLKDRWLTMTPVVAAAMLSKDTVIGDDRGGNMVFGPMLALEPVRKMLIEGGLVGSAEQMVSERIDGVRTRHYRIEIQRAAFQEALTRMRQIAFGRTLTETEFREMDALWEDRDMRFEVWIDKDAGTVKRLGFDISAAEEGGTPFRFVLTFDAYGVPIEVAHPEDAEEFESVLKTLLEDAVGRVE